MAQPVLDHFGCLAALGQVRPARMLQRVRVGFLRPDAGLSAVLTEQLLDPPWRNTVTSLA